jgi:hypothetical protein
MSHGLGCNCRRCRNRQALGEDEMRLWGGGCAVLAVVGIMVGIVAGIVALKHLTAGDWIGVGVIAGIFGLVTVASIIERANSPEIRAREQREMRARERRQLPESAWCDIHGMRWDQCPCGKGEQ